MVNGSSDPAVGLINSLTTAHSGTQSSEVLAIKRRRTLSPAEKRRILLAYERCKPGERGALLRRERVYSSMLSGWRKHQQAPLATPRRGPKANPAVAQRNRDEQGNRRIMRLERQLERANLIIDAQRKLCALLGIPTFEEQKALEK